MDGMMISSINPIYTIIITWRKLSAVDNGINQHRRNSGHAQQPKQHACAHYLYRVRSLYESTQAVLNIIIILT